MLKGVSSRREERHSIWNLRQRGEDLEEGRGSHQRGGERTTFFTFFRRVTFLHFTEQSFSEFQVKTIIENLFSTLCFLREQKKNDRYVRYCLGAQLTLISERRSLQT